MAAVRVERQRGPRFAVVMVLLALVLVVLLVVVVAGGGDGVVVPSHLITAPLNVLGRAPYRALSEERRGGQCERRGYRWPRQSEAAW